MCVLIAHAVLMVLATYHGMGLHVWQYTPELNSEYYFWLALSSVFYTSSLFGFKTCLLLLYLQIFGSNKKFRIACYITLALTWSYLTPALLTEFLGCWPPAKKWSPEIEGHCMYDVPAKIFYGAGHAISDFVILTLPLAIIWRLKFSTLLQKIGLSVILCSGFMCVLEFLFFNIEILTVFGRAMAIGIARWAITVYNMVSYDRPWWAGISFTLSILEPNLGLICACVATFSPLAQLSYAKSRQWKTTKDIPDVEKNVVIGTRKTHDSILSTPIEDQPVLSATAYPIDEMPYLYNLHDVQAGQDNRVQPESQSVQHQQWTQIDASQNWSVPSPVYPDRPEDVGHYPQMENTTQSVISHYNPGHHSQNRYNTADYNHERSLPEQFPVGSSHPAYYTEFPSDLGQANVTNPVYYGAAWSQTQQPTYNQAYSYDNYPLESARNQVYPSR